MSPIVHSSSLSHVGIIMDGNGRWAKQHLLERTEGHLRGIQSVKNSLLSAIAHEVSAVSLYVFSTENWKRPKKEVQFILNMVAGNLRSHYPFYREHDIKVVHSGNTDNLGTKILRELKQVTEETAHNNTLTLNLAFNYGGKDEIARAVQRYINDSNSPSTIDESILSVYLDQPSLAPVDLVIRTGGQKRLSNFLLWQSAYAELYFSDILWPDWTIAHMDEAITFFHAQDRRFGGITIE